MPTKPRKRKQPGTISLLDSALRNVALWVQTNGTRQLSTAEGRRRIDTALESLSCLTETITNLKRLETGTPHPLGFDLSGDLITTEETDYEPDHGVPGGSGEEHEVEAPVSKRTIGFRS